MEFLKRHCRPRTLGEALKEKGMRVPFTKPLVAVTFDDGYQDNYTQAWPILKRYDVPATIFLMSNHVDGETLMWQHRLYYLKEARGEDWVLQCAKGMGLDAEDFRGMMLWFKRESDRDARDNLINQLWGAAGLDRSLERKLAKDMYLSWEQVREMSSGGIEFGSHTRSHPYLSSLRGDALHSEIDESKKAIEERLGKEVDCFCYPYGDAGAYNQEVLEEVRKAGYKAACTAQWGARAFANGCDEYQLRRKGMNYSCSWQMWLEISGWKDRLRKLAGRTPQ
jgi:peptidoglycan/xylan/chitin deacetylase (PgdA/CDA1 family)